MFYDEQVVIVFFRTMEISLILALFEIISYKFGIIDASNNKFGSLEYINSLKLFKDNIFLRLTELYKSSVFVFLYFPFDAKHKP